MAKRILILSDEEATRLLDWFWRAWWDWDTEDNDAALALMIARTFGLANELPEGLREEAAS